MGDGASTVRLERPDDHTGILQSLSSTWVFVGVDKHGAVANRLCCCRRERSSSLTRALPFTAPAKPPK